MEELSSYGVHPARYTGEGCTGCGICFYCCPEPGAITVYRLASPKRTGTDAGEGARAPLATQGGEHAATL
jgi:Fe-S-cluster-containing hydrogenase component 2